jgi:phospholipid/cholesterol/gamma-HCH transport system ATP-binding protein
MIEFKSVYKQFGEHKVLNNLNFKIGTGEIVFILGTSGTGKSVSLKLIVGLLQSNAGEIWVDGQEVSQFSESQFSAIRKKCGMVFQHPALFDSMTVFDNVAYGLRKNFQYSEDEIKSRVKRCLEIVRVQGVEEKYPQEISYGMQKRVSLARTVANQPKILLFDEPTTGLDPITTNAVNQLIKELSVQLKTTSIVVSHDMQCALDIADKIIVLDKGAVVAEGTPKEILSSRVPLVVDFLAEVKANA